MTISNQILTRVLDRKIGAALWLDGAKLLSFGWCKGDSAKIITTGDAIELHRTDSIPRSTTDIQNFSGRKKPNSNEVMPILELPIKKCGLDLSCGVALIVQITRDIIYISVNDYVERRKERSAKFIFSIREKTATLLNIDVDALSNEPFRNISDEADLCEITFNPKKPRCARFFNAIMSAEKANPYAIRINNVTSPQNTPQDGLTAILKSIDYQTIKKGPNLYAIAENIDIDTVDDDEQAISAIDSLFDVATTFSKPLFSGSYKCLEEREQRLFNDRQSGVMSTASFFTGGGTIEAASIPFFDDMNIKQEFSFISEKDDVCMDVVLDQKYKWADGKKSYGQYKKSIQPNALILRGDITEFDFSKINYLIKPTVATLGIPCNGASPAGSSKLNLENAESHSEVGHLFWPSLKGLAEFSPPIVLIENTKLYRTTNSFLSIKEFLNAMEYETVDGVLNSHNEGSMESRNRMFLIACDSKNSLKENNPFDENGFVGPRQPLNHFLDHSILHNDESYRDYDHLKAKLITDREKGKGFAMSLYDGSETMVTTIRASYNKAGSCDQYLICPSNPEKWRLFRKSEHSLIKGFPDGTLDLTSIPATHAHRILGQGVTWHTTIKAMKCVSQIFLGLPERTSQGLLKSNKPLLDKVDSYQVSLKNDQFELAF